MDDDADAKMILIAPLPENWKILIAPLPENWKRPPGLPRITWLNTVQ